MTSSLDRRTAAAAWRDAATAMAVNAFTWLYDTDQPVGALQQHHSTEILRTPERRVEVTPVGYDGLPVLVVTVADPVYPNPGNWDCTNPLDGHTERLWWERILDRVGRYFDTSVCAYWNWQNRGTGAHLIIGSLALHRPASPALRATVSRYQAGCPDHPAVRGEPGAPCRGVFCDCGWYQRGHALLCPPARLHYTQPVGSSPAAADQNTGPNTDQEEGQ